MVCPPEEFDCAYNFHFYMKLNFMNDGMCINYVSFGLQDVHPCHVLNMCTIDYISTGYIQNSINHVV